MFSIRRSPAALCITLLLLLATTAATAATLTSTPVITSPGPVTTDATSVAVQVEVAMPAPVSRIDLFDAATTRWLGASTDDPDTVLWDTAARFGDGDYLLKVKVTDAAGNVRYSRDTVAVTVAGVTDKSLPHVSLDVPAENVAGTVTLPMTASDDRGLDKVEVFLSDGRRLGLVDAPYDNWVFDTFRLPSGVYTLKGKATDTSGNVRYTRGVQLRIDNLRPDVTLTGSLPDGATATGPVEMTVTAADDLALARVELWIDGGSALVGRTVTSAQETTASFTWDPSGLPSGTYALKAKAVDSLSNVRYTSAVTYVVPDGGGSLGDGEELPDPDAEPAPEPEPEPGPGLAPDPVPAPDDAPRSNPDPGEGTVVCPHPGTPGERSARVGDHRGACEDEAA